MKSACSSRNLETIPLLLPLLQIIITGSPFLTIQKAIESSSDGDTILVSAGTYYENLNVSNKTMVIIGEDNNTTIIDAENVGKAIYNSCSEPASFEIHNFTIQNGLSDDGSALYLNSVESALLVIKLIAPATEFFPNKVP